MRRGSGELVHLDGGPGEHHQEGVPLERDDLELDPDHAVGPQFLGPVLQLVHRGLLGPAHLQLDVAVPAAVEIEGGGEPVEEVERDRHLRGDQPIIFADPFLLEAVGRGERDPLVLLALLDLARAGGAEDLPLELFLAGIPHRAVAGKTDVDRGLPRVQITFHCRLLTGTPPGGGRRP